MTAKSVGRICLATLFVVGVGFIVFTSHNPLAAFALIFAVAIVLIGSFRNILTHQGSVWSYFSDELNEYKVLVLLLSLFTSYMLIELRSMDSASQSNNTELLASFNRDSKELLLKLESDKNKFANKLDIIEGKLDTTTNGRLVTERKGITEAFVATCESASKKIRASYVVSSRPSSSKYFTDKIIKLMRASERVVYEVVLIVDEKAMSNNDINQFDAIVEEEWLKRFHEAGLDDRFTLKVMQSRTPPNLDVLIADEKDVYLSFYNRPVSKLNMEPYNSDQVLVYKSQASLAPYFSEWFSKNYWERSLLFKDWKYQRILQD